MKGKGYKLGKKWRCSVCGYVYEGQFPPEACPSCGTDSEKFIAIEETIRKIRQITDHMSADQIEDYLTNFIELEKIFYTKQALLFQIQSRRPSQPIAPTSPEEPDYSVVYKGDTFDLSDLVKLIFDGIGMVILVPICALIIIYPVVWFFSWGRVDVGSFLWGAIIVTLVLMGIAGIYCGVESILVGRKNSQIVRQMGQNYNLELEVYNEKQRKFQQEQLQWEYHVALWEQECEQLRLAVESSRSNLDQLYEKSLLAPKYRNFAAVCSLFEYFQAGTCDTMKEAYNKYDQELLLGHIVDRLDKILQSLEQIKGNQVTIYSAIQTSNRLISQLIQRTDEFHRETSRQLADISKSTSAMNAQISDMNAKVSEVLRTSAITAYCSKVTQEELTFIRKMSQYEGIIGNPNFVN